MRFKYSGRISSTCYFVLIAHTHIPDSCLSLQDQHFSEEKGFIVRIMKRKTVFAGIRALIHGLRGEFSTTELFDLLMNWFKLAFFKYKNLCLLMNRPHAIVTKWLIVNNFEQNGVQKNSINVNIRYRYIVNKKYDKNVTSGGKPECFHFFTINELKCLDFILLLLKSTKHVASTNAYIISCMCLGYLCEILSRSVRWLLVKTLWSDKR